MTIPTQIFLIALSFIFLFGPLIGWNIYLMKQNQVLIDKLMSKNFGEYATAKSFIDNKPAPEVREEVDESLVAYDEQRARELNGLAGMG